MTKRFPGQTTFDLRSGLALSRLPKDFVVRVDVNDAEIELFLGQSHEDELRNTGYFSRCFSPSQRQLSHIEKYAYQLQWSFDSCISFRTYEAGILCASVTTPHSCIYFKYRKLLVITCSNKGP